MILRPAFVNISDTLAYQTADSKFYGTIIKQCGNNFSYHLFQKGNLLVYIDLISKASGYSFNEIYNKGFHHFV